jgi:flavin-dependent thymidylate synthase
MKHDWLEDYRDNKNYDIKFSRDAGETDDRALLADVAFNRHSMNDGEHVGPSDNGTINVGTDNIVVDLIQPIDEDQLKTTLAACTQATIGLKPGQRPETADWEEMLKGGLQTALETQVIVFAVSGVSRTCTHQLVRSRRAAFHQQSQRASYMGDMPDLRMPESVWKNDRARRAFMSSAQHAWSAYEVICDEDISYQDARFVLPEGTVNFILLEYPIREFLNVYAYRGCSMFQWEIVDVMRKCRDALVAAHPFMEPYVKISCEKTGPAVIASTVKYHGNNAAVGINGMVPETVEHHCTFQGWEDVEGQCDFPWAKQEARTFKPEFHRITRNTDKEGSTS